MPPHPFAGDDLGYALRTRDASNAYGRRPAFAYRLTHRARKPVRISLVLLLVLFRLGAPTSAATETDLQWTMLNVAGPIGQADCHLLRFPDGRNVLIDVAEAGDAQGAVLRQLERAGVSHVSLVIISHFHGDHYGRLLSIIEAGIGVDRVVFNLPDKQSADRERPWGCNFEEVIATLEQLQSRGIRLHPAAAGERLLDYSGPDGVTGGIDVLCAYDGANTPIGATDVNDTSIILRVFYGSTRALFTGDLNHALGAYLAHSEIDLRADILKAPHHGTEGCAPNTFFDRVNATAVLVPAPTSLWLSQRSERIRTHFKGSGIPAYVNGLHGNVTVRLGADGYAIESEIRNVHLRQQLAPSFTQQPMTTQVPLGAPLILSAIATGSPRPKCQWVKDGVAIDSATDFTLRIPAASSTDSGRYTVVIKNENGAVESDPADVRILATPLAPPSPVLANLSARGLANLDGDPMIAGFAIAGGGCKRLLIRAVGPTLTSFGVTGALANPSLTIMSSSGEVIAKNDDWDFGVVAARLKTEAERVGAFSLEANSLDAALEIELPTGSFTALARAPKGDVGICLVEVYDLEHDSPSRLINLSARSWTGSAHEALVAGFVVEGTGELPLLIRAIGPSLARFGIQSPILHPTLSMTSHDGMLLNSLANTDRAAVAATAKQVGAFEIPQDGGDVALLHVHKPGSATAVVGPRSDNGGVALVELYVIP